MTSVGGRGGGGGEGCSFCNVCELRVGGAKVELVRCICQKINRQGEEVYATIA